MKNLVIILALLGSISVFAQGVTINENISIDTSKDVRSVVISGESAKVVYNFLDSKEVRTGDDALTKNAKEVTCTRIAEVNYICTTTVSKKGKFYNF